MKEKLINEIYDELRDMIMKGIPEEYVSEVREGYREHLNEKIKTEITPVNYEREKTQIIRVERVTWEDEFYETKLQHFTKDESFNELRKISLEGFNKAREALENSQFITIEESTKKIMEMVALEDKIRPYNKFLSKIEIAQAILDYQYAAGDQEKVSTRLSYLTRQKTA